MNVPLGYMHKILFAGSKLAAAGQSVVKVAGKDWQGTGPHGRKGR